MGTPWGMINARKETKKYENKSVDLQKRINKAVELLKMDNPDIERVIKVLVGESSE